MNKLLLILTLTCTTSCTRPYHTVIDFYDTCPSDAGYSCPIDGSPCPFCTQ